MRAACLLLLLALPASAQEADGGSALEFSAAYTGDLRRNTTGGIAPGTAYADEIDLGIAWESDRVFCCSWHGLSPARISAAWRRFGQFRTTASGRTMDW